MVDDAERITVGAEGVPYAIVDDATGACVGRVMWDGITPWQPPEGHRAVRDEAGAMLPPEPPPVVPATISAARGRIVLRDAGLLSAVRQAVAAAGEDSDLAILFNHASTWERAAPEIEQMGAGLGLSAADLDSLFIAAGPA